MEESESGGQDAIESPRAMCVFCQHPVDEDHIADRRASIVTEEGVDSLKLPRRQQSCGNMFLCTNTKSCCAHAKAHGERPGLNEHARSTLMKSSWRVSCLLEMDPDLQDQWMRIFEAVHALSKPTLACLEYTASLAKEESVKADRAHETKTRAGEAMLASQGALMSVVGQALAGHWRSHRAGIAPSIDPHSSGSAPPEIERDRPPSSAQFHDPKEGLPDLQEYSVQAFTMKGGQLTFCLLEGFKIFENRNFTLKSGVW